MKDAPIITKVEAIQYQYTLDQVGKDYNTFNMVYEPGGSLTQTTHLVRIHTDQGIVGEYPGGAGPSLAEIEATASYLIGRDALARESIYNDLKRGSRHWAQLGMGVVDICLWDIAGKTAVNDHHPDAEEGIASFREKRAPKFNKWLSEKFS